VGGAYNINNHHSMTNVLM